MSIEVITHRGVEIVVSDYTVCKDMEEVMLFLEEVAEYHRNSPVPIRTLGIFTGHKGDTEFLHRAKQLGKEVLSEKTVKGAVIGVDGLMKMMLNAYNMFTNHKLVPFDTKNEALDYLAGE